MLFAYVVHRGKKHFLLPHQIGILMTLASAVRTVPIIIFFPSTIILLFFHLCYFRTHCFRLQTHHLGKAAMVLRGRQPTAAT